MPKVSVIIPVYGVEKFITRCARSLFEQTLDDIEYIFVDDCTLDNSIKILREILKEYPHREEQTRIVKMLTNSGQAAVRQHGIQLATGDYIIHCDSDDWVDVHAYEIMYNKAVEGNYDIVFCDFYNSDGNKHLHIKNDFGDMRSQNMLYAIICKGFQWSVCGGICKKSVFTDNEIIYPKDNNGEDFALMTQMVHYSKRFYHIKQPLYYYFQNPSSITKSQSLENYKKRLEQHQNNVRLVTRFFERENMINEYEDVIVSLKLYGKAVLAPISYKKEFRELWYNTYPELEDINFLFRKRISYILKMKYWSVKTHTYFVLRMLRRMKWKFMGRSKY